AEAVRGGAAGVQEALELGGGHAGQAPEGPGGTDQILVGQHRATSPLPDRVRRSGQMSISLQPYLEPLSSHWDQPLPHAVPEERLGPDVTPPYRPRCRRIRPAQAGNWPRTPRRGPGLRWRTEQDRAGRTGAHFCNGAGVTLARTRGHEAAAGRTVRLSSR